VATELDLAAITTGSVSAPAGCGKTHLIAKVIAEGAHDKPLLVLTHTNAGVAAMRGRVQRRTSGYRMSTIDGWAMRLIAMFPGRSGHNGAILDLDNPRSDYPSIREAAAALLESGNLDDVLASTYSRVIVDEYQDCNEVQHRIVTRLAAVLPTVVLGDPLQAIFGFGRNPVVDWDADVLSAFPLAGELATPHRWINAGEESLGRWLLDVRKDLVAGRDIDLRRLHGRVSWVELDGSGNDRRNRLAAGMTVPPPKGGKVLIIADSMNKAGQYDYARQLPGAVVAEAVDMSDLVGFCAGFSLGGNDALAQLISFAAELMTNVGPDDLLKRVATLKSGREKKPPSQAEMAALAFDAKPSFETAANLVEAIAATGGVRVHRPTILTAFYEALRQCRANPGLQLSDAAIATRERGRLIGRPLATRTVGSTLLLKGLEADVSVVLDVDRMDASHLYVAMTRGSRRLVICSHSASLPVA
jgi:hypothetical protein